MKFKRIYLYVFMLLIGFVGVHMLFLKGMEPSSNNSNYDFTLRPITKSVNGVNITVDPRIELLSVVQSLGNYDKMYNLITKESFQYKKDINKYFSKYSSHEAVKLFDQLSSENGYSFDAPPTTMLYLTENFKLRDDVVVTQYLLDRIGGSDNLQEFIKALEDFYLETDFMEFFEENISYYEEIIENTGKRLGDIDFITELEDYYGMQQSSYNVVLVSLFRGGFGPKVDLPDGRAEIYSIIGPSNKIYSASDATEIPNFGSVEHFKYLQRHEFSHSFVNPTTEKYLTEANKYVHLFTPIENEMRQLAYPNWEVCLNEHIVRAVTTRLAYLESEEDGKSALAYEKGQGFIYIDALLEKLVEYEENRDLHLNFEEYYPILLKSLDKYNN